MMGDDHRSPWGQAQGPAASLSSPSTRPTQTRDCDAFSFWPSSPGGWSGDERGEGASVGRRPRGEKCVPREHRGWARDPSPLPRPVGFPAHGGLRGSRVPRRPEPAGCWVCCRSGRPAEAGLCLLPRALALEEPRTGDRGLLESREVRERNGRTSLCFKAHPPGPVSLGRPLGANGARGWPGGSVQSLRAVTARPEGTSVLSPPTAAARAGEPNSP